jgi:hypothetical protein
MSSYPCLTPLNKLKRVQINVECGQPIEMATAFGAR